MSSDARVWREGGERDWYTWMGSHDGECRATIPHDQGDNLAMLLTDIERCMGGRPLRWLFNQGRDGTIWLKGYSW